jgi:glycosyltransferase involved in cell wall biosynthesis
MKRLPAATIVLLAVAIATSALAADRCLFNSEYTLETLVRETPAFLGRFPDHVPQGVADAIRARSGVLPPPIERERFDILPVRGDRVRIVWPHRWEHDKNPEEFFAAVSVLAQEGHDFEVAVAGQEFQDRPPVFDHAGAVLGDRLIHMGEPGDPDGYARLLASSDVAVSTAENEFFGLAMMEACMAGCRPVVPDRLVYPEIYPDEHRYGDVDELTAMLRSLVLDRPAPHAARVLAERHTWEALEPHYVAEFDALAR